MWLELNSLRFCLSFPLKGKVAASLLYISGPSNRIYECEG